MDRERAISFAGWNAATSQGAGATVDLDRIAGRLEALDEAREARGIDPFDDRRGAGHAPGDTVYRRPIDEQSHERPEIGRWAAVALEADFEAARVALAPLLARRAGIALPAGPGGSGVPGLIAMRKPASSSPERWLKSLEEATARRPPYYLLLLGGPDRFPFEVQMWLEQRFATGRLDVGKEAALDWEACRAWAEKLVRYEEGSLRVAPQALLYSFATDEATRLGHAKLSVPLADWLDREGRRLPTSPDPPRRLFQREATTAGLCEALVDGPSPALVLTTSHGLERFDRPGDRDGWGALTDVEFVGRSGSPLDAGRVRAARAFAPGAVMVSFACFSAGVPAESAHRALSEGIEGSIPGGPFTASLPRALLGHPLGPIAFVGHWDRATSESFSCRPGEAVPAAFSDFVQWSLGKGGTLGQAMSGFREGHAFAAVTLALKLGRARGRPDRERSAGVVDAWIAFHDAAGFMLLGDPVTRVASRG